MNYLNFAIENMRTQGKQDMKTEQKETTQLNTVEFSESDHDFAERIAKRLGFTQYAYTSTSALIGLYCLPDRTNQRKGVIVKTPELGFLYVQCLEDLNFHDMAEEQFTTWKGAK